MGKFRDQYLFPILSSVLYFTQIAIQAYGDWILENGDEETKGQRIRKAFIDTFLHGVIAFICWFCVRLLFNSSKNILIDAFSCMAVALLIDIDHVFRAGSFDIDVIRKTPGRGIFHSATLMLVILLCFFVAAYFTRRPIFYRIGLIIFLAQATHIFRDAKRHGVWFWPVGTTAAISFHVNNYITIAINFAVGYLYYKMVPLTTDRRDNVV